MENNITKDKLEMKIGFTDEELNIAKTLKGASAGALSSNFRTGCPFLCTYIHIVRRAENILGLSYDKAQDFVMDMVKRGYASLRDPGKGQDNYPGSLTLEFTPMSFNLIERYNAKEEVTK
ncbi:MAG: hypothetical protein WC852_00750 [Candidatus Nanoarchaeia archaeon]|jgi:hypothetical protein